MSYRYDDLVPGGVYHICTRGVEQRNIFRSNKDKIRFLKLLIHYLPQGLVRSFSMAQKYRQEASLTNEGEGLVDLIGYCLMPNHVHLLVRENTENGTSQYMHRLLTSYAKYFNISERRSGSLFVNPFKAVLVDDDEQLLHVSRYVHLNPYVAHMIKDPYIYRWSSLSEYIDRKKSDISHTSLLRSLITPKEYREFIMNEAEYAKSLADIKHLLVDNDV